ncbi:MAG: hypothetical protein K6G63_02410 [Eubacterium sp.]|nr:hypothetical protein [Eubacterium sp.]
MMMRLKRTVGAMVVACSVLATAVSPADTFAAKAPKFAKKSVTVKVGKKAKVSLKNVSKKAKVKWAVKSKKVAKLVKKTKKTALVKGVKAGKTQVTATVKVGKKKKVLKCKVVVKGKSVNKTEQTPVPGVSATPASAAATASSSASASTSSATPASSAVATVAPTTAPTAVPTPVATEAPKLKWVSTWGTAEEKTDISGGTSNPGLAFEGSTVRQIVRVTTTGAKVRLKFSNQYGKSDVEVKSVHIAKQGEDARSPETVASTDTKVTVNGSESFSIPAGKTITTDPVDFQINALENMAISMYFGKTPTSNITGHRGARATTYQMAGNTVSDSEFNYDEAVTMWYFLAEVSMELDADARAVVCFGDSITDGYGTDAGYLGKKPDSYTRWGDYFAKRLQANEATKNVGVINEGIGANSILGSYPTDAGKDRFLRDLVEHDGVEYCILHFGVNDITGVNDTNKYNSLIAEYKKMIQICHENNVKIYVAPILPFGTSDSYTEKAEELRVMLNTWLTSDEAGADGIIDFASAVVDPANPINIREEYTHKDGLHPYDGYSAMADAIDLKLFER